MSKHTSVSRRHLLKAAGAAGAVAITGFPAISYAQADAIKIGHLTPRTGFLGTLGEYAVQAVDRCGPPPSDIRSHLPDGRGRGAEGIVPGNLATDRRTATKTGPSVATGGADASSRQKECAWMPEKKWPDRGIRRRSGPVARAVPSLRSDAGRRGRPRPDQPGARTRRSRPCRLGAAAPPGTAGAAETPANPGYGGALANARCPEAGARSCSSIADRSLEKDCGAFGARLRSWCGVRRISRTERTALAPGAARGSVGSSEGDRDREEDEVPGSAGVHARAPGDPESPRLEKQ